MSRGSVVVRIARFVLVAAILLAVALFSIFLKGRFALWGAEDRFEAALKPQPLAAYDRPVAEDENAAHFFELGTELLPEPGAADFGPETGPFQDELSEFAQLRTCDELAEHQELIEELSRARGLAIDIAWAAIERDASSFLVDYAGGLGPGGIKKNGEQVPFAGLARFANVLVLEGKRALCGDDPGRALAMSRLLAHLGEALHAEPSMISRLIGLYVERQSMDLLRFWLEDEDLAQDRLEDLRTLVRKRLPSQRLEDALAVTGQTLRGAKRRYAAISREPQQWPETPGLMRWFLSRDRSIARALDQLTRIASAGDDLGELDQAAPRAPGGTWWTTLFDTDSHSVHVERIRLVETMQNCILTVIDLRLAAFAEDAELPEALERLPDNPFTFEPVVYERESDTEAFLEVPGASERLSEIEGREVDELMFRFPIRIGTGSSENDT